MIVSTYVAAAQAADQATTADWLEAWATVAAAVGTVLAFSWQALALKHERRTRRSEVSRLDRERRRLEMAQARTIALHNPDFGPDPQYAGSSRYSITVGNYGSEPISHVVGTLFFYPEVGKPIKAEPEIGSAVRSTVVPPGKTEELFWSLPTAWVGDADVLGPEHATSFFRADILFTDVRGQRWSLSSGDGETPLPHLDDD